MTITSATVPNADRPPSDRPASDRPPSDRPASGRPASDRPVSGSDAGDHLVEGFGTVDEVRLHPTAPASGAGGPGVGPVEGEGGRSRLVSPRFLAITAATFAYFLGLGALLPTLPRYVEDELGGGGLAVGLVVGTFSVAAALLRPFAGRLGDLRGRRILVVGGSALAGSSMFLYAFVDSTPMLIALRVLTGIGEAAMWVGAATAVQDLAPDDRRGEAASYFSVALYAGLALGPAIGESMIDGHSYDGVWFVAGGITLVAAILGLATPASPVPAGERQPFRLLHPAAVGPGVILFLGLLPFVGFAAFLSLYGPEVSIDDTAPVFFVYAGLVLVIRVFGAKIPDTLGWRRASTISLSILGACGILLAVWSASAGVWVATVGLAIGMSLLFPALFSLAMTAAPEAERSQAVGTFSLFFDLASGLGTPFLGLFVTLLSYRASFAAAGLLALGGIFAIGMLVRRQGRIVVAGPDVAAA